MSNISNIIENFLIEALGAGSEMSICRNELANYFSCAPSQINYVLSTRFTEERGFVVESRRGGGGSVIIARIVVSPDSLLGSILKLNPNQGLSATKANQIVERMLNNNLITKSEADLLACVISDKALLAPAVAKDGLRVGILKSVAASLLKRQKSN